jgi:hypothetical protein
MGDCPPGHDAGETGEGMQNPGTLREAGEAAA